MCGNENIVAKTRMAGRAGTPGTSRNTLDVATHRRRSVPRIVPSAARRETCLSTRHGSRDPHECHAQVRSAVVPFSAVSDAAKSGRSRDDATACLVATRRARGRTAQRSCRRLPTRHCCRDPGAPGRRRTHRGPIPPGTSFSCHPVTARKKPDRASPKTRAAPKKGPRATAGMSGEAPFSTRNRRAGEPDRGRFRGQVSGKSPGISPPKFRPSSIARKSPPISRAVAPIARGTARDRNHPQARVPTTDLTGRSGLRSTIKRASSL